MIKKMSKKAQFRGKYFVILLCTSIIIVILITFKFINSQKYNFDLGRESVEEITQQSSDTSLDSIEKDLENTNFDSLNSELEQIEKEFEVTF